VINLKTARALQVGRTAVRTHRRDAVAGLHRLRRPKRAGDAGLAARGGRRASDRMIAEPKQRKAPPKRGQVKARVSGVPRLCKKLFDGWRLNRFSFPAGRLEIGEMLILNETGLVSRREVQDCGSRVVVPFALPACRERHAEADLNSDSPAAFGADHLGECVAEALLRLIQPPAGARLLLPCFVWAELRDNLFKQ